MSRVLLEAITAMVVKVSKQWYRQGYLAALKKHVFESDGVKYVGIYGKTYEEALSEIEFPTIDAGAIQKEIAEAKFVRD